MCVSPRVSLDLAHTKSELELSVDTDMKNKRKESQRNLQSSYLRAAEYALKGIGKPATAEQITKYIKSDFLLRTLISGKTPEKTIQARISTDIKKFGSRSSFYRTAPATFGLCDLSRSGVYSDVEKRVYHGFNRSRQVDSSLICGFRKDETRFKPEIGFTEKYIFPIRALDGLPLKYFSWSHVKDDEDVFLICLFIVGQHRDKVISFEASEYLEKEGQHSDAEVVGITGFLKDDDPDLFDASGVGFYNAVRREFVDFYGTFSDKIEEILEKVEFCGIVYENFSQKRRNKVGLVAKVSLSEEFSVENHKLGARSIHWRSLKYKPNNIAHFEPWSSFVFRDLQDKYIHHEE